MDVTLVLLALVVLLITWLWRQRKPSGLPPGYPCYPIVGSLYSLPNKPLHLLFVEMNEKYGQISSFAMGSKYVVVLNGYDVIKDALVTRHLEFANRPDPRLSPRLKYYTPNFPLVGIGDAPYSEEWKRQRSSTVQILRKLGFGKHAIQLKMQEETRYIIEEIMSHHGKPFDPYFTVTLAVMNVLCGLIFGERYDTSDPVFNNLHKNVQGLIRLFFLEAEGDFIWPYSFKSSYKNIIEELKTGCKIINDFSQKKVQEQIRRIERDGFSDEPVDFVEAYLKELQSNPSLQQNWLPGIINDLFLAGAETASVACTWTLLYLADRQDVQAKCQKELDRALGSEPRDVDTELRSKCPYTEATIMETMRLHPIFPVGLIHATLKDIDFRGYKIPKDAWVFVNLYGMMRDPKVFAEPDKLKPERFIDDDGQLRRLDQWAPFSMGRRSCLGEQLTRQELFIFIATLVHRFNMTLPKGVKANYDSMDPFMLKPHAFQVIFESRL